MADRGDGVYSELSDFLIEVNCPECGKPLKAAPVWEYVLRSGYSACSHCWVVFTLKQGAKLDGIKVRSEDLERVVDDIETANAGSYLWNLERLEKSRGVAVDFFISVGLTAFFDGLEHSYPTLNKQDYELTWRYLSQAGALAVDNVDTRLIADAFEKLEKYKPEDGHH
ncbi:MAG: hypothetical protein U0V70_20320 [Terriglobia bacterium]